MYRVELKVNRNACGIGSPVPFFRFLMYRVELKAHKGVRAIPAEPVPNVPCGVESLL